MRLAITTLSENTASSPYFLGELGLSILIETESSTVLFDAGQSISVNHNVDFLGVDLSRIDKVVLSHGHFDHTGGLHSLLQRVKRRVEIFGHPDIWAEKYERHENRPERFIGIPFRQVELEGLGACFNLSREPVILADGILTTGEVPMKTEFEEIDTHLFVKVDGEYKPDLLFDDQAITINTGSGLVVVLGCAHRGMINTLNHARNLTGVEDIKLVIGGSHLVGTSEEHIWQTIAALRELQVQRIGLCHCTGLPAAAMMVQEFGDGFFFNNTGNRIEL